MKKVLILMLIVSILITGFIFYNFFNPDDYSITIIVKEQEEIISEDFIYNYEGSESFPSVIRSSGEKPYSVEFKGIEISEFFNDLDIDISKYKKITFNAFDGYRIAISAEEILEPKNAYLVYAMDGEFLKPKKRGGTGPFRLVIRRDPFSQRWIKHIDEIIIE